MAEVAPTRRTLDLPWRVLPYYRCFGCSPHNEHGLQLSFEAVEDRLECRLLVGSRFESYPGVVHGGITTAACDEAMGNLLVLRTGQSVFTTTLRMRYVSPLTVGVEYRCVARCDITAGTTGSLTATAEVLDADGALLISATGSYQAVSIEQARSRMDLTDEEAQAVGVALGEFSRRSADQHANHNPEGDAP